MCFVFIKTCDERGIYQLCTYNKYSYYFRVLKTNEAEIRKYNNV